MTPTITKHKVYYFWFAHPQSDAEGGPATLRRVSGDFKAICAERDSLKGLGNETSLIYHYEETVVKFTK